LWTGGNKIQASVHDKSPTFPAIMDRDFHGDEIIGRFRQFEVYNGDREQRSLALDEGPYLDDSRERQQSSEDHYPKREFTDWIKSTIPRYDAPTARLSILLSSACCLAACAAVCGFCHKSNSARLIGIALGIAAPLILAVGLTFTSGLY
jgi:hypothetical protein